MSLTFSESEANTGSSERIWFADVVLDKRCKFGQFYPVAGIHPSKDGRGFAIALVIPAKDKLPDMIAWTWIWANTPQGKKLKICCQDWKQIPAMEGTEKDKRGVLRSTEGEVNSPEWVNISESGVLLWNMDYPGLLPD